MSSDYERKRYVESFGELIHAHRLAVEHLLHNDMLNQHTLDKHHTYICSQMLDLQYRGESIFNELKQGLEYIEKSLFSERELLRDAFSTVTMPQATDLAEKIIRIHEEEKKGKGGGWLIDQTLEKMELIKVPQIENEGTEQPTNELNKDEQFIVRTPWYLDSYLEQREEIAAILQTLKRYDPPEKGNGIV